MAENATDIIYRIRLQPQRRFDYISPAVTTLTGFAPEEFYQINNFQCFDQLHPDDQPVLENLILGKIDFNNSLDLRWVCKDGRTIWTEMRNAPIYDESGNLIALEGIARDITERKNVEDQLKYLILHDSLTGLHNRTYFEKKMYRFEKKSYTSVSLIMCDIDGLKIINDTMGHEAGDKLLVITACIIKQCLSQGDVVARIGGDEFAILLVNSNEKIVEIIYQRIKGYLEI